MKKIFMLIFIISIMIMFAGGNGIGVTNPKSSTIWNTGTKPTITWNSAGVPGKVKIRLLKPSGEKEMNIADNVDNNDGGSYNQWKIPHSIAKGQYKVRVKSMNNQYMGESALFWIKKGIMVATEQPVFKKLPVVPKLKINSKIKKEIIASLPDFKIIDIVVIADNSLVINYMNIGHSYSGPLEMRFTINGTTTKVEKNVTSSHNTMMTFLTGRTLLHSEAGEDNKVLVDAYVNPSPGVTEIATANNQKSKEVELN